MATASKQQSSRLRNSALNMATGLVGQLWMTFLKFVIRTVFLQTLGVEYLGIGGLFSNILSLLSLTELGIDTAINFKMYKPLAENDEHRMRVLMKFYKQAYIIIGFVIFGLGLCVLPLLQYLIKDYDKLSSLNINAALLFILYLLQSVSSYWFFAYRTTIIKTAQKTYILNLVDFWINFATCVAQIIVLLVFKSFIAYVTTVIVFNIIKNGVNALISQRMFPNVFLPEKDSISKEETKGILKDCGALLVYKLNSVVVKSTDNLVLSSFVGLAIVGIYSNYLMIYMTLRSFLGSIYTAVKASMGNIYATESLEKSYFMFRLMDLISILAFGTSAICIAVCIDEMLTVWLGESFVIAAPFSLLVAIELLFYGIKLNLSQIRVITGVFRQYWTRPILSVIVNLVVSIVLVQYIGIYGVIIGTLSADLFTTMLIDPIVIHRFSFKNEKPASGYFIRNGIYFMIVAVVGFVDYLICSNFLVEPSLWHLIVHLTICALSLPIVLVLIYWKSDVLQYLLNKVVLKKLSKFVK